MIYAYTERNGQTYVGFYVADKLHQPGYRIVRRAQYRNRQVADGHFERTITAMASRYQTWTVVLVMGDNHGHINPYIDEAAARAAIVEAWALGAVQRCYLFGPDGTVKEIGK